MGLPDYSFLGQQKLVSGREMTRFMLNYLYADSETEKQATIQNVKFTAFADQNLGDLKYLAIQLLLDNLSALVENFDFFRECASTSEYPFSISQDFMRNGMSAQQPETLKFLIHLKQRCLDSDAIGCHTSELGHQQIADVLIKAFDENYTGKDNFLSVLEDLYPLIEKYGPSQLQFIINQLFLETAQELRFCGVLYFDHLMLNYNLYLF